jgi:hypothetical protein
MPQLSELELSLHGLPDYQLETVKEILDDFDTKVTTGTCTTNDACT